MRQILMTGVAICCLGVAAGNAAGALWNGRVGGGDPYVHVRYDFVEHFDEDLVTNSSAASASYDERSGSVCLPGIFLHPRNASDAIVAFPEIDVPSLRTRNRRPFLVFRVGFRDGVPWDTQKNKPNGVRFLVVVEGEVVFSEEFAGVGWQARAVDMARWEKEKVTVEFHTNAIEGNTSYDWCVFGQPMLVSMNEWSGAPPPDKDTVGLAVAEVECKEPSTVTVTMGALRETARLAKGTHWIPLHFTECAEVALDVESGDAELVKTLADPYDSRLSWPEMDLSSPLVTVGRPFDVHFSTKNVGLGVHTYGERIQLIGAKDSPPVESPGKDTTKSFTIGRLRPGETERLTWQGLVAAEKGDWFLRAGPEGVRFHVFGPEPARPSARTEAPEVAVTPGQPVAATVSNAWSRLCLVVEEEGRAYAIAETWDGAKWQRAGSLYPLAVVKILEKTSQDGRPVPVTLDLRVESLERSRDSLVVNATVSRESAGEWPVTLTFAPEADGPRIRVTAELTSPMAAQLLAFYGPTVLAGDRAYGAEKDFAIFPGLEYLEDDEHSSSERDLAYPLSDRRVPAVHKIATPLMAVQGDDSLIALMWDANQEWAAGERHPAARFLAPKFDSGYGHIHMSLFAPSVGKYVEENTYEAKDDSPYALKKGETLELGACLVLDHKARYAADSVVHGPHKGALALQAMQHWFDVYGFTEPSKQPREWDAERALCRDAYLHAVWSEDPPGWRHCHGWNPGLFVGHAVPLMMDLRAGVDEPDRGEVQRRIDLVLERALKEQGKQSLWSNAACHIMAGELPFYYGYLGESMKGFVDYGLKLIEGRENGLWVWRPGDERRATLGKPGDHTLGQAARPSYMALRAARMTGDPELAAQALEAMKQMERYEVPRGAQTWECPLYQPDILAAGQAVRAYCEAYRLTGDSAHLEHARYWAWTGLPFLYTWELDGYPTMRYNVISVIGSTFYRHSWLGLPVVWCGMVYAYALQDLAEFDDSFDWRRIAQGITNSTMWQQYADGPSKGTYPDSWNMVKNRPNPADINPENILVNEFRLRGQSPEIRFARFERDGAWVVLNSGADIVDPQLGSDGSIRFSLRGATRYTAHSLLAPVPEPKDVTGLGERVTDSDALQPAESGWLYDAELRAVIIKHRVGPTSVPCAVSW